MNFDISSLMQLVSVVFIAVAVVCILTTVITEVTKNTKYLNKIPTELEVIVLSIVLAIVVLFACSSIFEFAVLWYYVVAAIILGFISSYVSMFGWESFVTIYNKFKIPSDLREVYKLTSSEKKELSKIIESIDINVEEEKFEE